MPEAFPFRDAEEGASPLVERLSWRTDVIGAVSGREQRRSLRVRPRRAVEWSAFCRDAREAAYAQNLLFGAQAEILDVPLWPYVRRLTADVPQGTSTFFVDGDPREDAYLIGGKVMAWASPFSFQVLTVSGVFSNSVTTSDNAAQLWPAGTAIVPVHAGRLAQPASMLWESRDDGAPRVRFDLEPIQTGTPVTLVAAAPSSYAGHHVLDLIEPHRDGDLEDMLGRRLAVFDPGLGDLDVASVEAVPHAIRGFAWLALDRTEAAAMRGFLAARRGRWAPFWLPSYQADARLAEAMAPAATLARVEWAGYTERLWTPAVGRRRFALHKPGAALSYQRVTNATHGGGSPTEDLTLSPGAPSDYAAGSALMQLRFCRLEEDDVELRWRGGTCEARFLVRELPLEEPTT